MYVRGNPVRLSDPSGNAGVDDVDSLSSKQQEQNGNGTNSSTPQTKIDRPTELWGKWKSLSNKEMESAKQLAKEKWGVNPKSWYIPRKNGAVSESYGKLYAAIEKSAQKHNLSPSFLQSVAMGEDVYGAVNTLVSAGIAYDNANIKIDSYQYLGLDNIGKEAAELVKQGYLDKSILKDIEAYNSVNEKNEPITPARIAGFDSAIELVAATLDKGRNDILSYAKKEGVSIDEESQKDIVEFLTYANFNRPSTARDAVNNLDSYTQKYQYKERNDQTNVRFNTMLRMSTSQMIKELGVYETH